MDMDMINTTAATPEEVKSLFERMPEEMRLLLINKTVSGVADTMETQGYAAIPFYLREALVRVNSASGAPTA